MREHCDHARFVWNLAVEQQSWWRLAAERRLRAAATASRSPGGRAVAGRGVVLGAAAGFARFRPGHGRVLRQEKPGWQAVIPSEARSPGIRDPRHQAAA